MVIIITGGSNTAGVLTDVLNCDGQCKTLPEVRSAGACSLNMHVSFSPVDRSTF